MLEDVSDTHDTNKVLLLFSNFFEAQVKSAFKEENELSS